MPTALRLPLALPVRAHNAGLFVYRGEGRHGDRTIDSHELIFVRQGVLRMYEERQTFAAGPGEALILRAGRRHGGSEAYPKALSFYWIHFEGPAGIPTRKRSRGRNAAKAGTLEVPRCGPVARPDRLAELFHWFLNDQEAGALTRASADLLLLQMLQEVARRRLPEEAGDESGAALAAQANRLIRTRFHEELQTSSLAQELDCNPDYLGRVYRRAYGYTLTEGIHRARLKEARALLLEGRQGIDRIARAVGYGDPGYFRRVFRRQEGLSPRAYRRLHARMHINTR